MNLIVEHITTVNYFENFDRLKQTCEIDVVWIVKP